MELFLQNQSTIFAKGPIVDVRLGSKYASEIKMLEIQWYQKDFYANVQDSELYVVVFCRDCIAVRAPSLTLKLI